MNVIKSKSKNKKSDFETKSISIWNVESSDDALKVINSFLNKQPIMEKTSIMVLIANPTIIDKNVRVQFD